MKPPRHFDTEPTCRSLPVAVLDEAALACRVRAAVRCLVPFAAGAAILVAGAALAGRVYRNDSVRIIAFEVPHGWQQATQIGYPRILLDAAGPDGARLLLATQKVVPGTGALIVASEARAVLAKQGFREP